MSRVAQTIEHLKRRPCNALFCGGAKMIAEVEAEAAAQSLKVRAFRDAPEQPESAWAALWDEHGAAGDDRPMFYLITTGPALSEAARVYVSRLARAHQRDRACPPVLLVSAADSVAELGADVAQTFELIVGL